MATNADWVDEALAGQPALMDADQTCGALMMSRATLNRRMALGLIRAVRHRDSGSARLIFPRAEVARYLRSLGSEATR